MKTIGQYTAIDLVTLRDNRYTYQESYLLTADEIDKSFEVDLTGDYFFNELKIVNRKTVETVKTLDDVRQFVNQYGLAFPEYENGGILVGGSRDMLILPDLTFGWAED